MGISLLLVVADRSGWASGVRLGVEVVMRPPLRVVAKTMSSFRSAWQGISMALSSQERIAELERRNAMLAVKLLEASRSRDEEDVLAQADTLRSRFDLRVSQVVTPGSPLVIENVGLQEGGVIVTAEGALVGIVDHVGKWMARVRTIMAPQMTVPVDVTGTSRDIDAEIRGSPEGVVMLEHVLTEMELSEGMTIVTSGSDDSVPPGLLIGWTGKQREKREEAVYQSVEVVLAARPDELRYVLMLVPRSINK